MQHANFDTFYLAEYPYINYFVIQKTREHVHEFFKGAQHFAYDIFSPTKIGYCCNHSIDLYDESATIARPPIATSSKKPTSDLTGYIVCVYHVLKGDDGEKFERNWLYWTGIKKNSQPFELNSELNLMI